MIRTLGSLLCVLCCCLLPGCHGARGGPRVDFDLRWLDNVSVVPIQTPYAVGTATLLDDGRVLSCSHVIPRLQPTGEARIAGRAVRYRVLASGDALSRTWTWWPPAPDTADWVIFETEPPLDAAAIFGPVQTPPLSPQPPRVDETLYVVGYTAEDRQFIRRWVPTVVIDPPHDRYAPYGQVIWLRGASDAPPRPPGLGKGAGWLGPMVGGMSGSPVLRRREDGTFEVCAMLVAREADDKGISSGVGLAIPIPNLSP